MKKKLVAISVCSYAFSKLPKTKAVTDIMAQWGYDYRPRIDPLWQGFLSKITYCASFIKTLIGEATHVLFIDAADVVLLCGPEELMERYLALNHPWVCAAEPHVWPAWSFKREEYPSPEVYNRYLNSGVFIGEVEHIADCYDQWAATFPQYNDDQHFLASHYIQGYPEDIHLDTNCNIIQCMCGNDWNVTITPGECHNNMTGTDPAVIHFNGGTDICAPDRRILWDGVLC